MTNPFYTATGAPVQESRGTSPAVRNEFVLLQNAFDGVNQAFNSPSSTVFIGYTFDATTTAADPGAGKLRLNNATQNTATAIYADNASTNGSDVAALLTSLGTGTSTVKSQIRIQKLTDATKWLIFDVAAVANPTGYKNITATCTASSAANPFADGDALAISFARNGDKGDKGDTGATGPTGPAGSSTVPDFLLFSQGVI